MAKKRKTKRHIKTLSILLIVESILLVSITTYYYVKYAPRIPSVSTQALINQPIQFDTSSVQKPQEIEVKQPYTISNLEILPSDYDETLKKLETSTSQHQKTELLLYSQTEIPSKSKNLTEAYQYLKERNLNILIPQQYIDSSTISQLYALTEDIKKLDVNSATQEELEILLAQNDSVYLKNCISTDIEAVLNTPKENCTLNESTTPYNLYQDVISSFQPNNLNTPYDSYISNNFEIYALNQTPKPHTSTVLGIDSNTYNYYFDTDIVHLEKLKYISEVLNTIYKQTKVTNTQIEYEIKSIQDTISTLIQYTNNPSNISKEDLSNIGNSIVENQSIELPPTLVEIPKSLNWYLKNISIDNGNKTFIAPTYQFEDTTKDKLLSFEIKDNNFNDSYDVKPIAQRKGSTRVPILMYHHIYPLPEGQSSFTTGLYVNPQDFEKQLAYLVKHNYKTISPQELYDLLKAGKNPTQKSVMLTFDDSLKDQYTNAYPLLKKYGLTGVFYVVSAKSAITNAQLKEMSDAGMIIDSHSATHRDLQKLEDPSELSYEITTSKVNLTARTGVAVKSIAYPGCVANSQAIKDVSSAGYLIGVSCGRGIDHYLNQRLYLSRVHAFTDMTSFVNLLSGID